MTALGGLGCYASGKKPQGSETRLGIRYGGQARLALQERWKVAIVGGGASNQLQ